MSKKTKKCANAAKKNGSTKQTATGNAGKRGKSPLLEHRRRNCECCECWQYIYRSGPPETNKERIARYRYDDREIKRAIKQAKIDVKEGRQFTIDAFFGMK